MLNSIISTTAPCAGGLQCAPNSRPVLISRSEFIARFPQLELVVVFPDYDAEDHLGAVYCTQEFDSPGDIYDEIANCRYSPSDFAHSLDSVKAALLYALDATAVLTRAQWRERKVEAQRRELEEEAQTIARKHGVKFGTFEFLEALEREEQSWDHHREGLREDGLCIGYGVSYAQWREEDAWAQDQRSAPARIRDFLSQHCPLLMAHWAEKRLRDCQGDASA